MNEYNKGSHTVYDMKYHVIWVTKYRCKVLNKPISSRLRELIRQGCEARNITIVRGKDHVHMLIDMPVDTFGYKEGKEVAHKTLWY